MRQLLIRQTPGGPALGRLEQHETVWEQAYAAVMTTPAGRPLRAFWLHYYGAEAEMRLDGADLAALQEDIDALLRTGWPLTLEALQFLSALRQLCMQAEQARAAIEVIAD